MSKLGFHTSLQRLLNESDKFFEVNKTFQVFLGSPRTLAFPKGNDLAILLKRRPDIEVVVHSPYVVSLCKNQADPNFMNTLKYYIKMANYLEGLGSIKYVTHIGARPEGMSVAESMRNIYWFCEKWLMATTGKEMILCLEVDSGSKKGTKMGHINVLKSIVEKLNNPRIRLCLDTEHAYANGMDIEDVTYLSSLKSLISVVHWNAVPKEVTKGSHLDRHSETDFYNSVVNPRFAFDALYDGRIPFIYEVKDDKYVLSNNRYVKEVIGFEGA